MNWKLMACAAQGRRHTAMQIPCQDKVRTVSTDGLWIGALSDGAGSASHSHYGAQCVVDTVCSLLSASFDTLFDMADADMAKAIIIEEIFLALAKTAQSLGVTTQDLAATLLFVAVKDRRMLMGHIGDGVICYSRGGMLRVASRPTNGEFANSTVFVTSRSAQAAMRLIKGDVSAISGFCLMSDGTAASLYDHRSGTPMPVLSRLLRLRAAMAARPLQQMLEESFRESVIWGTQDDCSIVLMSPAASAAVLSDEELADLMELPEIPVRRLRWLRRCRTILTLAGNPRSLKALSRAIHLKPKYAKRYIRKLLEYGLLVQTGTLYTAASVMKERT